MYEIEIVLNNKSSELIDTVRIPFIPRIGEMITTLLDDSVYEVINIDYFMYNNAELEAQNGGNTNVDIVLTVKEL
jgi:hypothetical protein